MDGVRGRTVRITGRRLLGAVAGREMTAAVKDHEEISRGRERWGFRGHGEANN